MLAGARQDCRFGCQGVRFILALIVFLQGIAMAAPAGECGAERQQPSALSFSEWHWLGVRRQEQPHSCGLAAWKTWLEALGISVDQAERALALRPDLATESATLLDLYNLARAAGVPAVPFRFSKSGLSEYLAADRPPLLLHLATGAGHFVVVSAPADAGRVYIADPAVGWRSLPLGELLELTSGSALVAVTEWPGAAGQDWTRGLARARERGRAFQMLLPGRALATEVGVEVTARQAQRILPRSGPADTPLLVVQPEWLPLQTSLVTVTRWGGRAGLSAELMLAVPVTEKHPGYPGNRQAGIGLSWGGLAASASRKAEVSFSYCWQEGPLSRYAWELAIQHEVDTDPVRQCMGLAFTETRTPDTSPHPGNADCALRLWGGMEVLLTPAFVIGGEAGLIADEAGRASVLSGLHCVWLRPEGDAWRLQLAWLAGQSVNIRLAYRHQWVGQVAGD
ncbi:MAG: hypothetical protein IMX00_07595 [Limnochordales bacterium]|nr:hypothetical protein [Limnochordales bacterium]